MAGGPLQVVGDAPVVLVAQAFADDVGHHRGHATQLGVAEGVLEPLLGQESAVRVLGALGDHHGAVADVLHQGLDLGQEPLAVELDLREQDDDGDGVAASEARPPAAAIQPAWRPITSRTNTLVDVLAMERTSKLASRVDTAMYLATDPNPGQVSVMGRSLSTVLGTWMAWMR